VLFNPDTGETRAMRTKEDAADYRYFPDPDLPPLVIALSWKKEIEATMPELPDHMAKRYVAEHGLSEYDANQLTRSPAFAKMFEEAVKACSKPKQVANWMLGEVAATLNREGVSIEEAPICGLDVARIIDLLEAGAINRGGAKTLFSEIWATNDAQLRDLAAVIERIDNLIEAKGLKQMNDSSALEKIVDEVMAANAPMVEQFRAGKDKAFNALVGLVMKASKGKANPQQVNDVLRQKLQ
jgi:aspartyl-tRNA(Asn)/glutamyl-tRNA(Gln) amidotransferase subunit B